MFKVLYSAYELRRAKLILTNRPIITLFGRIAASDWLAKHIASIVRVACVSGVERGRGKGNLGAGERVLFGGHGKKIFWDHFSKSLVTIQVFTSETWAPTRLKNGGKCDCLCDCDL